MEAFEFEPVLDTNASATGTIVKDVGKALASRRYLLSHDYWRLQRTLEKIGSSLDAFQCEESTSRARVDQRLSLLEQQIAAALAATEPSRERSVESAEGAQADATEVGSVDPTGDDAASHAAAVATPTTEPLPGRVGEPPASVTHDTADASIRESEPRATSKNWAEPIEQAARAIHLMSNHCKAMATAIDNLEMTEPDPNRSLPSVTTSNDPWRITGPAIALTGVFVLISAILAYLAYETAQSVRTDWSNAALQLATAVEGEPSPPAIQLDSCSEVGDALECRISLRLDRDTPPSRGADRAADAP